MGCVMLILQLIYTALLFCSSVGVSNCEEGHDPRKPIGKFAAIL